MTASTYYLISPHLQVPASVARALEGHKGDTPVGNCYVTFGRLLRACGMTHLRHVYPNNEGKRWLERQPFLLSHEGVVFSPQMLEKMLTLKESGVLVDAETAFKAAYSDYLWCLWPRSRFAFASIAPASLDIVDARNHVLLQEVLV